MAIGKSIGAAIALLEDQAPRTTGAREAAQWFVDQGIPVVPAEGKRPIGGSYAAKLSTEGITDGYGVALGNGIIALDYDAYKNPTVPFETFLKTYTVKSGSGVGYHLYYSVPKELSDFGGDIDTGITIRACGSIVIGPKSKHPDGGTYEVYYDVEIVAAPLEIVHKLKEIKKRKEQEAEIYVGTEVEPRKLLRDKNLKDKLEAESLKEKRSHQSYDLIMYAAERGATNEQLAYLLNRHAPSVEKAKEKGEPLYKELARLISKARVLHDHANKACDEAECSNPPHWFKPKIETGKGASNQPKQRLIVETFADVKKEVFHWYDKPWIPEIGLAMVAGESGAGKSTYLIYQMAKLTNKGIKCLYLGTREQNAGWIAAQMDAAGVRKDLVLKFQLENEWKDVTAVSEVVLKYNASLIEEAVKEHDVKVIFLDPANAYMGIDDERSSSGEIRHQLELLKEMCERLGVAVVFVKHTKKKQSGSEGISITDSVYGSTAWREVPRVITLLVKMNERLKQDFGLEEDDPTDVILTVGSGHNYAADSHPAAQFHQAIVWDEGVSEYVPKFDYLGSKAAITTANIDNSKGQTDKQRADSKKEANSADDWLEDILRKAGFAGVLQEKLREQAKKDNVTWGTVKTRNSRNTGIHADIEKIPIEGSRESLWRLREPHGLQIGKTLKVEES